MSTHTLCLCTEPHYWGGNCIGPALDVTTAKAAALARLRATQEDPTESDDDSEGAPLPHPVTGYIIGEADMALFVGILEALTTDQAEAQGSTLEDLVARRDIGEFVNAVGECLASCACATGGACTRHTASPRRRSTYAHA